jgi:hypothetical protein
MPQRALYDLAEAALGMAPEMQWSVDESVARRETERLFIRLYDGSTTSQAALEVFVLGMSAKLQHCVSVIEQKYELLLSRLEEGECERCPALHEFFEFFTGISKEAMYTLNEDIARRELAPLFLSCGAGRLSPQECQDAVFDYVIAKRDTTLLALQDSVKRLKAEMDGLPTRAGEVTNDARRTT